ncbi:MAG: hypothetical protein HQL12_04920 [Candidatus Omnitrophica bacterium]|nr:hypothetical protein [Candidatus Omnitrophota bacterium]
MLRTNTYLPLSVFICLFLINPVQSRADSTKSPSDKSAVINSELDDVEKDFPKKDIFQGLVTPSGNKAPSNVKNRVHSLDTGVEFLYYRYEEPSYLTIDGSTTHDVTLQGPMYGYYADYAYRPKSPNILNNIMTNVYFFQGRYAVSRDLKYKGSGISKNEHDDDMEFRGLIGKDYSLGADSIVTPYFGFGYRYLIDHGNGHISSVGNYGDDRKSHYYYLPLGGYVVINMSRNWEIDPNAEYDIFLQGWQKSFLSDGNQFGNNNPDLVNHQDHGYGVRASVKFLRKGPMFDFYVEPYIRYWHIEESKPETVSVDGTEQTLVEPNNTTTEIGSKFGIQF